MFGRNLTSHKFLLCLSNTLLRHTKTCPTKAKSKEKPKVAKKGSPCVCPPKKGGTTSSAAALVRGSPGKVRFGFIPNEWFVFFQPKTGISGLYVLGIVGMNYLLSKEIYILEHEYYSGLSIALMVIYVVRQQGKGIGTYLDKEVDAAAAQMENSRKSEIDYYKEMIAFAKDAQHRAQGQKMLMDAKKENVLMQLEAAYRERCMLAYRLVKGRMDYHLKRYRSEARIHQKWMLAWILESVRRSITPEFEKQALDSAIRDLANLAGRVK